MASLQLTVRSDSVAVLAFDQPGSKANVLAAEVWAELEAAIDSIARRPELKGLILTSAKPDVFIAGADLKLLASASGPNDPAVRGFIETGLRTLNKLESVPFPTAAAIDGAALGGGLEVALACDFRTVGPNPKLRLGLPEVTLGLIPGWGGTQRLPRLIGLPEATTLIVSGQPFDGAAAQALGLVDLVAPAGSDLVDATARFLIASTRAMEVRARKQSPVASAPETSSPVAGESTAAAEARRVVAEGARRTLVAGIAAETEAFMRLAGSDESKQLIAAFFASRKKGP